MTIFLVGADASFQNGGGFSEFEQRSVQHLVNVNKIKKEKLPRKIFSEKGEYFLVIPTEYRYTH